MIIIGPALNTGIGQLSKKYTRLFGNESVYYVFGKELPQCDNGLIFMLPIPAHLEYAKYAKRRIKNLACMTICETETVHEDYGLIMKEFKRVAVSSEFCKEGFLSSIP